jgi:hypothetical protein
VFYDTWTKAGINHVQNLIDKWATRKYLENKYNLHINFLEYESLKAAIPSKWKDVLTNDNRTIYYTVFKECKIKINGVNKKIEELETKEIYWEYIHSKKAQRPTSEERWTENNDLELEEGDWEIIYKSPFHLSSNSKIQMVQFKTVHRILATNHNMHKWKVIPDPTCSYCTERDTITHFLYDCNITFNLWQSIMKWWDCTFNMYIPITSHEILFGIPNENEEQIVNLYNYMILHAKYYIYIYKKKGLTLDLYEVLLNTKHELILKQDFYKMNNKPHIFQKNGGNY